MDRFTLVASYPWIAIALAIAFAIWIGWQLQRVAAAMRLDGRRRDARSAEVRALALLERHGYAVRAAQETALGRFIVDGEEKEFDLRADAIVEKDGERLVVEVKTGAAAALETRATRRQLLEYAYVFGLDGILLVDMNVECIVRVEFPGLCEYMPPLMAGARKDPFTKGPTGRYDRGDAATARGWRARDGGDC